MIELTVLKEVLAAAKTLKDLLKRGQPNAEIQGAVASLYTAVSEAQQREAAMLAEISRLKGKLSDLEDWRKTMADYRLESVGEGALAYVHQPTRDDPKTAHWLCQRCADEGHKVVLQCFARAGACRFGCSRCEGELWASDEAAMMLGAKSYSPVL